MTHRALPWLALSLFIGACPAQETPADAGPDSFRFDAGGGDAPATEDAFTTPSDASSDVPVSALCEEISELCHRAVEVPGEVLDCHELGHDGVHAACVESEARCRAACAEDAGPVDAGSFDAGHSDASDGHGH